MLHIFSFIHLSHHFTLTLTLSPFNIFPIPPVIFPTFLSSLLLFVSTITPLSMLSILIFPGTYTITHFPVLHFIFFIFIPFPLHFHTPRYHSSVIVFIPHSYSFLCTCTSFFFLIPNLFFISFICVTVSLLLSCSWTTFHYLFFILFHVLFFSVFFVCHQYLYLFSSSAFYVCLFFLFVSH